MRRTLALSLLLLAASPLTAAIVRAEPSPLPRRDDKAALPASPAERSRAALDRLFQRLAAAQDEEEAGGIAKLIERRWMQSGSDTADLLMNRALTALAGGDQPLAIELLDRVLALAPGWAEAWNKRATVFFMLDDEQQAMLDLRRALAREPRHFGAWAGLGLLLQKAGDKRRALEAFRHALALHPYLDEVRTAVDKLTLEVDGRGI